MVPMQYCTYALAFCIWRGNSSLMVLQYCPPVPVLQSTSKRMDGNRLKSWYCKFSVTRLGKFEWSWWQILLQKLPKYLKTIWAIWKVSLSEFIPMWLLFGQLLGNIWLLFIPSSGHTAVLFIIRVKRTKEQMLKKYFGFSFRICSFRFLSQGAGLNPRLFTSVTGRCGL